jgi:hypothetical protein
MTKINVRMTIGYTHQDFEFDNYDEASSFVCTALFSSTTPLAAEITLVKYGEKETETPEE